ncbi:hypothetical protein PMG71_15950 [Roseofilum sp. BLCC_M154]|jgi:hypothetical protein|uniref:DUF4926 domain-containing protein n=1 Tax=Roseofilum acuticapitatum BLCC-M154 TaxID=3022444 RepID=A0ABT7AVI1_9CYAN|nr:hypothetical protein [Roseofilum acuticapitatum]MDJ1170922.1 hypothetical protein [Roseofilum acuticapitatum BLCC-M154]
MLKPGTLVQVLYPDYAAGALGYLKAEEDKGRWIVQLIQNPIEDPNEPLLLSLEESEFEVIDPQPP